MSWKDEFPKENRYFETENGILYYGDCLEIMKNFSKESIDLVLTDPPYIIQYKTNRRKNKEHKFCSPITNDNNPKLIEEFIEQVSKLLKPNTAFYSFGNWKTADFFKKEIENFFRLKNIIIWVKNNWTAGDLKAQYGQQYEIIFYANKGRRYIKGKRLSDVWFFNRVSGKKQKHQNEKPIELIAQILNKSSNENDLVLDPFLGSGTTALACERLNRRWIGIEINGEYCDIIKQRVATAKELLL